MVGHFFRHGDNIIDLQRKIRGGKDLTCHLSHLVVDDCAVQDIITNHEHASTTSDSESLCLWA